MSAQAAGAGLTGTGAEQTYVLPAGSVRAFFAGSVDRRVTVPTASYCRQASALLTVPFPLPPDATVKQVVAAGQSRIVAYAGRERGREVLTQVVGGEIVGGGVPSAWQDVTRPNVGPFAVLFTRLNTMDYRIVRDADALVVMVWSAVTGIGRTVANAAAAFQRLYRVVVPDGFTLQVRHPGGGVASRGWGVAWSGHRPDGANMDTQTWRTPAGFVVGPLTENPGQAPGTWTDATPAGLDGQAPAGRYAVWVGTSAALEAQILTVDAFGVVAPGTTVSSLGTISGGVAEFILPPGTKLQLRHPGAAADLRYALVAFAEV